MRSRKPKRKSRHASVRVLHHRFHCNARNLISMDCGPACLGKTTFPETKTPKAGRLKVFQAILIDTVLSTKCVLEEIKSSAHMWRHHWCDVAGLFVLDVEVLKAERLSKTKFRVEADLHVAPQMNTAKLKAWIVVEGEAEECHDYR